jgi:DNA-binding NtrC family response regulator
MARILVLEKQPSTKLALRRYLESEGHVCDVSGGTAPTSSERFDLTLVDAELLGSSPGLEDLHAPRVIVLTSPRARSWPDAWPVVGSLDKPLDFRALGALMQRCLTTEPPPVEEGIPPRATPRAGGILTRNPAMLGVLEDVTRLAPLDVTVLITGESGTGKELVARALHELGPGRAQPFEAIHCGAIVADLLESELFGHEKGSFTDAHAAKPGRLEVAGSGTVLLDEIGEMPLSLQVKLLRVLQEREFQRIGGLQPLPMRARVIAATHRDLRTLASSGAFREDLLHRLHVATLHLPPLRDRPEDVELLASEFLLEAASRHGRPARRLSPAALRMLQRRPWPGNVRELKNVVERAVILRPGPVLQPADFEDGPRLDPAEAEAAFRRALDREVHRLRTEGRSTDAIRSRLAAAIEHALREPEPGPDPPSPEGPVNA